MCQRDLIVAKVEDSVDVFKKLGSDNYAPFLLVVVVCCNIEIAIVDIICLNRTRVGTVCALKMRTAEIETQRFRTRAK